MTATATRPAVDLRDTIDRKGVRQGRPVRTPQPLDPADHRRRPWRIHAIAAAEAMRLLDVWEVDAELSPGATLEQWVEAFQRGRAGLLARTLFVRRGRLPARTAMSLLGGTDQDQNPSGFRGISRANVFTISTQGGRTVKIAIIGAGNAGSSLGKGRAARGHEVVFGVRDPRDAKVQEAVKTTGGKAHATTVQEAASSAEVVVLATPWGATQDAIRAAGDLRGKIVVDATNPLKPDLSGLALGHTTSAGEEVARWAAGAKVVKAFNTIGAQHMVNPRFGGQSASTAVDAWLPVSPFPANPATSLTGGGECGS